MAPPRKLRGRKAEEEIDDEEDISQLRMPITLHGRPVEQILNSIHYGSPELRDLLLNECDMIFECKVCRALFRDLPNFISHKRRYCTKSFSDNNYFDIGRLPEERVVIARPQQTGNSDAKCFNIDTSRQNPSIHPRLESSLHLIHVGKNGRTDENVSGKCTDPSTKLSLQSQTDKATTVISTKTETHLKINAVFTDICEGPADSRNKISHRDKNVDCGDNYDGRNQDDRSDRIQRGDNIDSNRACYDGNKGDGISENKNESGEDNDKDDSIHDDKGNCVHNGKDDMIHDAINGDIIQSGNNDTGYEFHNDGSEDNGRDTNDSRIPNLPSSAQAVVSNDCDKQPECPIPLSKDRMVSTIKPETCLLVTADCEEASHFKSESTDYVSGMDPDDNDKNENSNSSFLACAQPWSIDQMPCAKIEVDSIESLEKTSVDNRVMIEEGINSVKMSPLSVNDIKEEQTTITAKVFEDVLTKLTTEHRAMADYSDGRSIVDNHPEDDTNSNVVVSNDLCGDVTMKDKKEAVTVEDSSISHISQVGKVNPGEEDDSQALNVRQRPKRKIRVPIRNVEALKTLQRTRSVVANEPATKKLKDSHNSGRNSSRSRNIQSLPARQQTNVKNSNGPSCAGIHFRPGTAWSDFRNEHFSKVRKCMNEDKLLCLKCDSSFLHYGNLKRHIWGVHLHVNRYECRVCGFKSFDKADIARHIVVNHPKITIPTDWTISFFK